MEGKKLESHLNGSCCSTSPAIVVFCRLNNDLFFFQPDMVYVKCWLKVRTVGEKEHIILGCFIWSFSYGNDNDSDDDNDDNDNCNCNCNDENSKITTTTMATTKTTTKLSKNHSVNLIFVHDNNTVEKCYKFTLSLEIIENEKTVDSRWDVTRRKL